MRPSSRTAPRMVATLAGVAALVGLLPSCPPAADKARATRITQRSQLIGGPRALGEVGDWLIENDRVRFIIQDEGFSRGFGVFGGALLDADLVRPEASTIGDSTGGSGKDNFGEMFPAFFLEGLNPTQLDDPANPGQLLPAIQVEKDGSDGGDAVVVIRALGDDFLAITQNVNETALEDERFNPTFEFETRYILKPGAQHLEIETTIRNRNPNEEQRFPKNLLGNEIPTPFGDVVLFGAGNKVFLPHEAGFDLRFRLEELYAAGTIALPAFPGLTGEFIASASKDVSYGVMTFPVAEDAAAQNFAFANSDAFPGATTHSVHVPFIASAFTGLFQVLPPSRLAAADFTPGGEDEFTVRRAFIVGDGDISSISDVVYGLLGDETGTIQGRVKEKQLPRFVEGASVIFLKDNGEKVTQARTDRGGRFDAKLRPGKYQALVVVAGQDPSKPVEVEIAKDQTLFQELEVDSPAELVVTIVEENVGPVPAKATLVGISSADDAGKDPKKFLFDLSLGQSFQYTDFIPDVADDVNTRRYIETFGSSADGVVRLRARPGTYSLFATRGVEYDRAEIQDIVLEPGVTRAVVATIRRVVDTAGYVGADFHLHSQFSLDSNATIEDRVANYAAEGMEYAVSTDHNFVVDYQPMIQKLRLENFINTAVGLELTTIDRGHFNGFPLERQDGALFDKDGDGKLTDDSIASRTHGSFEWALRNPSSIFADLRALGRKNADGTIQPIVVQVNHPRDSILGYFDQYGVDPETLEPQGITNALLKPNAQRHPEFDKSVFSFDFDAVEVFNGKRFEFLKTFTVPENAPTLVVDGETKHVDLVSCCEITPGVVWREIAERKCPGDAEECACDEEVFNFQIAEGNCDNVGDIAFPGVVDDWQRILMTGKRVVGTANSDSHEPDKEEPGSPRTYVGVPVDAPAQVTPDQIVEAFQKGDVLMSNGPFIRVSAKGAETEPVGMGGTVKAVGGKVSVSIHVESASWVVPNQLRVLVNGEEKHVEAIDGAGAHDFEIDLDTPDDGFFLVEVSGSESLFPAVYPNEIPPLQFTDVIGSLGASFGLGGGDEALAPALLFVTSPYALTNPVWIDADADGDVDPAANLPDPAASALVQGERPSIAGVMKQVDVPWVPTADEVAKEQWMKLPIRKRLALARLPRWLWPSDHPSDVRRALLQFVRHAEP